MENNKVDEIEVTGSRGRKRNEHYIPRFILRGFADNGILSVFDFQKENQNFRVGTPDTTFFEKDFYEFQVGDKSQRKYFMPNALEESYANSEESVSRIINKIKSNTVTYFTGDEQINLASFAVMQTLRTPLLRETLKNGLYNIFPTNIDGCLEGIMIMLAKGEATMAKLYADYAGVGKSVQLQRIIEDNPILRSVINEHIFNGITICAAHSDAFRFVVGDQQVVWYKNAPEIRFAFPVSHNSLIFGFKGFSLVSSFFKLGTDIAGQFFHAFVISDFSDEINKNIIENSVRHIACVPNDEEYVLSLLNKTNYRNEQ